MARAVFCLSVCLSVCLVSSSHIPGKMNKTIQNLLQHYKIPPKERFNGKPVFTRGVLDGTGKMEDWEKKVFMGGVLEVYEKLIGQMLSQLSPGIGVSPGTTAQAGGSEVRQQLDYILKQVQQLRRHQYQNNLLEELVELGQIQTDNVVVQSKALWELPWLYQEASSLAEKSRQQKIRRRRRRQAQRVKTPQTA